MTEQANSHVFDQSTALERTGDDRWQGRFPPAYANMVGPFGGVIAATLLNGVLQHPDCLGDPVSMTVNFAGPIADDHFDVVTRPCRTNRSTQHWMIELTQGGETAVTATVLTGVRRDSWEGSDVSMPDDVPSFDDVEPFDAGLSLPWVANYDLRIIDGGFDPTGKTPEQPHGASRLWVRDKPARPLDFTSLMAISDCFFPRIFIRRQERMPAGTVSLTTYFHADGETLAQQGEQPILAEARAQRYFKSYFDQSAELWGANGQLLATTHQIVYYKG